MSARAYELPSHCLAAVAIALAAPACAIRAASPGATFATPADATAPEPSRGCLAPERDVAGWHALTVGGRERRYLLRLPPSTKGPLPLVLNFHGWLESAALQEKLSFMTEAAAARGMAVVYPEGLGESWNAGGCCGLAWETRVDDVAFVRALVRELTGTLCVDARRIFAAGMSNGALFSDRLACEASDVFAAIAPVAGTESLPSCRPPRAVPVMAFHGTWDFVVPYRGLGGFPGALELSARWAERDGCASPAARRVYERGDTRCDAADRCRGGTEVVLCTVERGGHTWPGGAIVPHLGHTTSDLDATEAMLDFFLAHPLRGF